VAPYRPQVLTINPWELAQIRNLFPGHGANALDRQAEIKTQLTSDNSPTTQLVPKALGRSGGRRDCRWSTRWVGITAISIVLELMHHSFVFVGRLQDGYWWLAGMRNYSPGSDSRAGCRRRRVLLRLGCPFGRFGAWW